MKNTKSKYDNLFNGLILCGIGGVLCLILFGAFGRSGETVSNVLVGVFGYAMYAYAVSLTLIGILLLLGFKPKVTLVRLIGLICVLISVLVIFHAITSNELVGAGSYSAYLKSCYISANTAGGILAGVFLYPLIKLNYYFAISLGAIMVLLSILLCFSKEILAYKRKKSKEVGRFDGSLTDLSAAQDEVDEAEVKPGLVINTLDGVRGDDRLNRTRFSSKATEYTPLDKLDEIRLKESRTDSDTRTKEGVDFSLDRAIFGETVRENSNTKTNKEEFEENVDINLERAKERLYGRREIVPDIPPAQEPELSKEESLKRAIERLYGTEDINERKGIDRPMSQEDREQYKPYTNSERLRQLKENLQNGKKNLERERNGSIFDVVNNIIESGTNDDYEIDKARNFDSDNQKVVDEQPRFDTTTPKEETEDLTAHNPEPLESFEDTIRRMREAKEERERQRKLNEHLSNADNFTLDNTRDISKGINKQFGGGVNFGLMNTPGFDKKADETEDKIKDENKINIDRPYPSAKEDEKRIDRPYPNLRPVDNKPEPIKQVEAEPVKEVEETPKKKPLIRLKPYKAPPIALLSEYQSKPPEQVEVTDKIGMLERTLSSFGIDAKVINTVTGSAFTRLELQMPVGISVKKIGSLDNDIAMCLEAKNVRLQIPIPGKNAFGVEIPNKTRGTVGLKGLLNSPEFNNNRHELSFAVGEDCDGNKYVVDLTKMPHLLVAGATGAGKSVCINTLICSILYKYTPEEVKMLLVDPKQVELSMYNGLPHMLIKEAICDKDKVMNMLDWAIEEMECRYTLFSERRAKNLPEFNEKIDPDKEQKMPYIVIIVDEVADIVADYKKEFEERIRKLAQKARAAGIILVLATQRPSVDVITGTIKSNLPSRIAFAVTSGVDSRTIIDTTGAEKLLRNGDMLFMESTSPAPVRIQGAFISGREVDAVCEYIRANNEVYFDPDIDEIINADKNATPEPQQGAMNNQSNGADADELFVKALWHVVQSGSVSISKLQRRYGIGYPRAARLVDIMEDKGFVSESKDNKPREVLISMDRFMELYGDEEIG